MSCLSLLMGQTDPNWNFDPATWYTSIPTGTIAPALQEDPQDLLEGQHQAFTVQIQEEENSCSSMGSEGEMPEDTPVPGHFFALSAPPVLVRPGSFWEEFKEWRKLFEDIPQDPPQEILGQEESISEAELSPGEGETQEMEEVSLTDPGRVIRFRHDMPDIISLPTPAPPKLTIVTQGFSSYVPSTINPRSLFLPAQGSLSTNYIFPNTQTLALTPPQPYDPRIPFIQESPMRHQDSVVRTFQQDEPIGIRALKRSRLPEEEISSEVIKQAWRDREAAEECALNKHQRLGMNLVAYLSAATARQLHRMEDTSQERDEPIASSNIWIPDISEYNNIIASLNSPTARAKSFGQLSSKHLSNLFSVDQNVTRARACLANEFRTASVGTVLFFCICPQGLQLNRHR